MYSGFFDYVSPPTPPNVWVAVVSLATFFLGEVIIGLLLGVPWPSLVIVAIVM